MNEVIAWGQQNITTVGLVAAAGYYFWPQIKTIFAGGLSGAGSKNQDQFLRTVEAAREVIEHYEAHPDEDGMNAARMAAARLFAEPIEGPK